MELSGPVTADRSLNKTPPHGNWIEAGVQCVWSSAPSFCSTVFTQQVHHKRKNKGQIAFHRRCRDKDYKVKHLLWLN